MVILLIDSNSICYVMASINIRKKTHIYSVEGDYPLLENHFAKFNQFIAQAKADGCKTLVHCQVRQISRC